MATIKLTASDSIQRAIDTAEDGDLTIILQAGRYEEKIEINRANVTLIGDGYPEIVFSDHHGTVRDGRIFNTGDSATFTVGAPSFKAIGIKFSNSYDYPYWHEYKKTHPDETVDTQAVAFRTVAGADRTICEDCVFSSFQDTVYADVGLHLFSDCAISGNVDFIFGAGMALFDSCDIRCIGDGFVAAPSTFTSSDIGFVFSNCSISVDNDTNDVYLARPWHPAGSTNRTPMAIFSNCNIDKAINKELWVGMNSRTPAGVERYWLPEESRFALTSDNSYADKLMGLLQQS